VRAVPVDGAVSLACFKLLDERLNVRLVVKVVGVDGSVTDEVSGAGDVAALRWCRIEVACRVFGLEVGCDA
jgi:hypothetical protein